MVRMSPSPRRSGSEAKKRKPGCVFDVDTTLMSFGCRPDKKRVYKCKIFDVKFENHREEPPVISPWFEFTLGGKIKVVDKRDQ